MRHFLPLTAALAIIASAGTATAQGNHSEMPGMSMPQAQPATPTGNPPPTSDDRPVEGMTMDSTGDIPGMQMDRMMKGATGGYSMMRDASGTAWQPDSAPMEGWAETFGDWSAMFHGSISGVYDHQGGPRGDNEAFSESMFMAMAQHSLGIGTLTLRSMLSLDPLMGKSGYPLLLQTGETANGIDPLIDRQHPHDLFMELAGIYSVPVGEKQSVFAYVGYPGEPALGPNTFMHRFSGMDDPAAPISHHWLDATHITYGVVTAGYVYDNWKIEGSVFNGREPDQNRWDFDPVRLNSASARLSWNPAPNWALQVSYGFIKSPEQLEPSVNQHRTTASASYNLPLEHGNWQTTFAWGRNTLEPGPNLDAFLLETAVSWDRHTIFARAENAQKNELFEAPDPLAGQIFRVSTLSLGYVYDIPLAEHFKFGLGAVGSIYNLPAALHPAYGSGPTSYMLFTRLKLD